MRALGRRLPSLKLTALENLWTYLPRVLGYLRPRRGLAVLTGGMAIPVVLAGLLVPWPLKILVDHVLGTVPLPPFLAELLGPLASSAGALVGIVIAAQLGVALLINSLGVLNTYLSTKLELVLSLDFRKILFEHTQRLSLAFHDRSSSGMVLYKINFLDNAPTSMFLTLLPLAENVLTLIGMFWICLLIHPTLALLSLIVVPFLYYSVGYYSTHIKSRLYAVRGMEGQTISIIHEGLAMLRVIVAFGREDHEVRRLADQGERANDARLQITVRQMLFSLVVAMATATGTALVLGYGAFEVLQGRITVGQLLVVMTCIASVYLPLQTLSGTMAELQEQLINLNFVFELLDTEPDIRDQPGAIELTWTRGHVTFEQVDFAYEGRVGTLQDVSFTVEQGQVVAVVGTTGAGKTTLANLIPRFYDPQVGRVLLDGNDIRTVTIKSLRQHISIVLQEPALFSTTIAENIKYGRLDATMEDVIEAAKAANVHDFIMTLPRHYATSVGERGAQLSGGERQRIGIARAFLKNSPILILDEPTSAIDAKTEAVILDAIDRLMVGRTTLLISHRLSAVRNADCILVLQEGRIIERGTHEELMAQEGLYKQLTDLQSGRVRHAVPC